MSKKGAAPFSSCAELQTASRTPGEVLDVSEIENLLLHFSDANKKCARKEMWGVGKERIW